METQHTYSKIEEVEQEVVEQEVVEQEVVEQEEVEQEEVEQEEVVEEENSIKPMIENELKLTISNFVNEIDLIFDYVDKNIVSNLQKLIKKIDNREYFDVFVGTTLEDLKKFEKEISYVRMSKKKIKSSDYEFLDNIVLFNNILKFDLFKDENKNTKRTIVKYLYNIYTSCFILHFDVKKQDSSDILSFVTELQEKLKLQAEIQNTNPKPVKRNNIVSVHKNPPVTQMPQMPQMPGMPSGFADIFQSLMSNGEIMNIATDLSKDIQNENIDPMTLLSSMMSGTPNESLQRLISNITNKIETKINNGDINKELLEQQAQSIIDTVQNSGSDFMPNMQDLMSGFPVPPRND